MEPQIVSSEKYVGTRTALSKVPYAVSALILGVSCFIYVHSIGWKSGDAEIWFIPWLNYIISEGPVHSLAKPLRVTIDGIDVAANYNPPYYYLLIMASSARDFFSPLTLIKLVSIAGTLACSLCVYQLLRLFVLPKTALVASACVFLLPTVVLNGPVWGQTEALWTGLSILAVAAALSDRWILMMSALGAALAFKVHAVFIGPFILYVFVSRRIPVWTVVIPIAVYCAMLLPAWLAGRSAWELATVYIDQASTYRRLSMNAPNPWTFVQYLDLLTYEVGAVVGTALAAIAGILIAALAFRSRLQGTDLLLLAVSSSIVMPYLLPKMHDRYFFLADLLAYALAVVKPRYWTIAIAVAVQLGSLGAYMSYLYDFRAGKFIGAALIGIALLLAATRLVRAFGQGKSNMNGRSHVS